MNQHQESLDTTMRLSEPRVRGPLDLRVEPEMKRRIIIALILLAAYPTAVACISFLEGIDNLEWSSTIMTIRLLTGIASFWGLSMFVGEYQSRKQIKKHEKKFNHKAN